LIFFIGKKVFSRAAGLLGAFSFVFYDMSLFYSVSLMPTSLAVTLGLSLIYLLILPGTGKSAALSVLAGLLFGITALASSSVIVFFFIFIVWTAVFLKRDDRAAANILALAAAFFLVILAVAARNYAVGKDPVPITSHSGISFYAGNNPGSSGSYFLPLELGRDVESTMRLSKAAAEKAAGRPLKPSEVSSYWSDKALGHIKADPAWYISLLARKTYMFLWIPEIPEGLSVETVKKASALIRFSLPGALLIPLAIAGILAAARPFSAGKTVLYIFMFSQFAASVLYFTNSRYKMLFMPLVCLFAGTAVLKAFDLLKKKNAAPLFLGAAVCLSASALLSVKVASYSTEVIENLIGVSYAQKGDVMNAEKCFAKAISINPADPVSRYNLGTLYLGMKKFPEAEKEFKEALRLNPDYPDAHNNLGTIYLKTDRLAAALSHFRDSLRINPQQENIKMAIADLEGRLAAAKNK
jgi:tetratricopeptide (TPR) repeat protein